MAHGRKHIIPVNPLPRPPVPRVKDPITSKDPGGPFTPGAKKKKKTA